jgi:hypothetical protein
MISQMRQPPLGVSWFGRACLIHFARFTKACKAESGKFGKQSARLGQCMIAFFLFTSAFFFVLSRREAFEQNLGGLYSGRIAFAALHHVAQGRQHLLGLQRVGFGHVSKDFLKRLILDAMRRAL